MNFGVIKKSSNLLGIDPYDLSLNGAILQKKYYALIKKYHPDINHEQNANEQAQQINNAYSILEPYFNNHENLLPKHFPLLFSHTDTHTNTDDNNTVDYYQESINLTKNFDLYYKKFFPNLRYNRKAPYDFFTMYLASTISNKRETFYAWLNRCAYDLINKLAEQEIISFVESEFKNICPENINILLNTACTIITINFMPEIKFMTADEIDLFIWIKNKYKNNILLLKTLTPFIQWFTSRRIQSEYINYLHNKKIELQKKAEEIKKQNKLKLKKDIFFIIKLSSPFVIITLIILLICFLG